MKIKLYLLLTVFIIQSSCDENLSVKSNKPNFILFIADDISWDDFGCYGNNFVNENTSE